MKDGERDLQIRPNLHVRTEGATKLTVSPAGSTPKGSLARRLADSSNTTARWVGKDAR